LLIQDGNKAEGLVFCEGLESFGRHACGTNKAAESPAGEFLVIGNGESRDVAILEAHERLALPLREIREESNPASEIGGHPKWSGIFLDCGISRGFCNNSTPRGCIGTPVRLAICGVCRCFFPVIAPDCI